MGAAKSGRVPNAYLFVGADPKALFDEALLLAGVLNCSEKAELGCGTCDNCEKIARRVHPDLLVISNPGKSIKIDEIRGIADFVRFGPTYASWKVIIVDNADLMTEEASNSFLKTLEEPHGNILFILTTTRESRILRTISSRCQKILFSDSNIATDETVGHITEKLLNIGAMEIPNMLALSDELSAAPDLDYTLNQVLYDYRKKVDIASANDFLAMKSIFEALRSLDRKGNKRLTLDNMFFSLKEAATN